MQKLTLVETVEHLRAVKKVIEKNIYIAYDIETTGLDNKCTIIGFSLCASEEEAFYIVLFKWDVLSQRLLPVLSDAPEVKELLHTLIGKSLIAHNSVFDCSRTFNSFGIDLMPSIHTDTMVLAHLLNENRRAGLKELAKEYFGGDSTNEQSVMKNSVLANGGKLTKTDYELYKADYKLLGKYGAQDALLTYKLFLTLVPELYAQGLDKFFYEEESMPLLRGPTYQLNTSGLKLDQTSMTELKKTLEVECLAAKDFIYSEIAPRIAQKYPGTSKKTTFNIGSNSQLAWLLFGIYELEFGNLTKGGKTLCKNMGIRIPYTKVAKRDFIYTLDVKAGQIFAPAAIANGKKISAKKYKEPWGYISVDKKVLQKLAPKYKWIERLLEYQRKTKILNTYIKGMENRVQYGIIRPSFLQHGTTSGRYASRDPNFQNLPRDDKRIKSCIVARPGKVFCGADYSQLEPRVFAYFSQDKRLLEAFNGTDDFYSVIGMEVYDKTDCTPQKDGTPEAFGVKYKKLRDLSKVIALASTYGATAHQLAPTTGKTIEDTQQDIDNYFERFPGVKEMMLKSHRCAKTEGQVLSLFGRPRRMPEAKKITKIYGDRDHADLPYEIRNMLNLAVNHTIQSTGASICNRAAIALCNLLKAAQIDAKLVVQVHDSLIVECNEDDSEAVSQLIQHAMENTVELPGVKLEAVPKIGKTLAEV